MGMHERSWLKGLRCVLGMALGLGNGKVMHYEREWDLEKQCDMIVQLDELLVRCGI